MTAGETMKTKVKTIEMLNKMLKHKKVEMGEEWEKGKEEKMKRKSRIKREQRWRMMWFHILWKQHQTSCSSIRLVIWLHRLKIDKPIYGIHKSIHMWISMSEHVNSPRNKTIQTHTHTQTHTRTKHCTPWTHCKIWSLGGIISLRLFASGLLVLCKS